MQPRDFEDDVAEEIDEALREQVEEALDRSLEKFDDAVRQLRGIAEVPPPAGPQATSPATGSETAAVEPRPESAPQARSTVPQSEAEPAAGGTETAEPTKARTVGGKDEPAEARNEAPAMERPAPRRTVIIEGDRGPVRVNDGKPGAKASDGAGDGAGGGDGKKGGGGGGGGHFHQRMGPIDFAESLKAGRRAVVRNLSVVMVFTIASNVLVLAIPIYLFQISDRVLTSRSIDTLTC